MAQVKFNIIVRDIENALELLDIADNRILVGLMVKDFRTENEAINAVREYQRHQIPVSVGLGAGDPAVWKSVAEVSSQTEPKHINQVFPAAGIKIFEPTGGITVEKVHAIVQSCIDAGVEVVIPHLYTSLVDSNSGKTEKSKIEKLLAMTW